MGRSGEVPFFFIRHARANVVNDSTPPHTSPRSLGVFQDRSSQRLGNRWRARPGPSRTRGLLWKALVAQRWRERRDAAINPRPRPNAPGNSPKILIAIGVSSPKEATSPKGRGPPPSPKSNFAAFSGKGHEAIFEFHASPLPGGFTTAAYLSGPAPADAR